MDHRYIFSASSYNTLVDPSTAFTILNLIEAHAGLVSAYDISIVKENQEKYSELIISIEEFSTKGTIYVDSGNYESFRFNDENWSEEKHINSIVDLNKNYLYFTYDGPNDFQNTNAALSIISSRIEKLIATGIKQENIIPIIHPIGNFNIKLIFDIKIIIGNICKNFDIKTIAIPERDLGNGILERARTVSLIKEAIVGIKTGLKLHLLGTGNPLSMLFFYRFGADTFDGLEWCRQSFDPESALLYHPHQHDFFKNKTKACNQESFQMSKSTTISYEARMAVQNAVFMKNWDKSLTRKTEELIKIIHETFPKDLVDKISSSGNLL